MSYCYSTGTYNQHPSHHVQSFSSSADVEQGEISVQNIPPAPIDFLNWNESLLTPHSHLAQPSTTLPIQTSLSAVPVLPHFYLDIVANSSRTLPVAAPVPVPHAALTKAALRTMMSFDDKDKENDTHNNNSAGGSEPLKIIADARTRVDFDNHFLHPNGQAAMNCNALVNSGNSKQSTTGRSKLVIRPISPSTLIALTEPCLMAWCTAFDDSPAEPGSSAYLPLETSDYNNYVDKAVYNSWGY